MVSIFVSAIKLFANKISFVKALINASLLFKETEK
jgi:hypothetical protein